MGEAHREYWARRPRCAHLVRSACARCAHGSGDPGAASRTRVALMLLASSLRNSAAPASAARQP